MSSDDDDDSSFQHQKLLSDSSTDPDPSTDATRVTTSHEKSESDSQKSNVDVTKDGHLYVNPLNLNAPTRPPVTVTHNGDGNECYRWLLHGRERKSSGGESTTDTSSTSLSSSSDSFPSLPLPKPPDGGWGWMVVLGSFLVLVICDGLSYCFGVLYYELLVQFGESRSKTSLVGSIFFGVSMILGPFASAMTTRFGCRTMTIVGGLLSSLGLLLSHFANSIDMLYFTFSVIVGVGFSFCFVTSVVIVHYYFDKRRSLATGLAVCGTGVGTFLFAPLMEYLISEYGWRGLFLVLSGINLNLVLCGMLFRPLKFTNEERWKHFCAEFDRLPQARENLELSRKRHFSECSFSTELEVLDEENRTMSMLSLPTFACEKMATSYESSEILMEALKNSRNPHLTYQRYLKNAYFRSSINDDSDIQTGETKQISHSDKTYSISAHSDPSMTQSLSLSQDVSKNTTGSSNGIPHNGQYQILKNSTKSPKLCTDTKKLKPGADCKKSTSIIDMSNAVVRPKPAPKLVSSMSMGRHNAMGVQLLLYRSDIFFRRQLSPDPQTTNNPCILATSCPELLDTNDSEGSEVEWKGYCECKHFLFEVKKVIAGMIDMRLFRNPFFTVFVISNVIYYFWSDIPYMYATDHAIKQGVDNEKASFLISIIGIFNAIGQLVFGIIGDTKINLIHVYAVVMVASGVFVGIVPLMETYWSMALAYSLFGFFVSVTFPFISVLLVNYLGVEQLTDAYGLLMLMQGIANIMGPPFAGWISDLSQSYDETFYLSGIFYALSGVVMYIIFIPRCQVEQVNNSEDDETETEHKC